MYSFVPRKCVLKVIYETLDSNRDWKSRHFFLEGDGWMRHPGETNYMPIDKTWGILDPSGIHTCHKVYVDFFNSFDSLSLFFTSIYSLFIVRRCPQIDIEEFNFLEKIFAKSRPKERTWAKLVNLNTVHWYCDGLEPTPAAIRYEERTRQRKSIIPFYLISLSLWQIYPSSPFLEMDDTKRRAPIRLQAAKNKEADVDPMGTGLSKPSTKRRPPAKGNRAPKRPKVSLEPVVGLMAEGTKTMTPSKHGADKGLMIPPSGSQKKPHVLLRDDPKYALEKLSSIISSEDYEDLGNHSTEAMGETSLFSIV